MNNFHFLRPEWFLLLPPFLLLFFWLARRRLRSRSWQAICDPELLPHLLLGRSVRRAYWPVWLLLIALLLALVALAGPVWQRQPQPLFRQQSALVILFDLSRSMQVADLKPSRFQRARLKITDLLRQRQEGQTALIVFAADAFTVTPLTEDRHTIEALLKSLDPALMPAQGSDLARAMQLGGELLKQASLNRGRLLLVTDEDQPELFLDASRQLQQQGFELEVLGVGSPEGAPIPKPEGGFLKDSAGNMILPKLNINGLQQLAKAGGGSYHSLTVDDTDLRSLLAGLDEQYLDLSKQTAAASGDRWREEGIWLLLPLTLLAALAFRRGWLLVLPLVLLMPPPAEALGWQELWRTPDQQAAQSFVNKDYDEAAQRFEDARWKASALYRDGKYTESAEQLKEPQTADDWYNKGNALAKTGNLPAALKAYQQAIDIEPGQADAKFNKELVERALQKQEQEQKKQEQEQEQKKPGQEQKKPGQEQEKSGQKQENQGQDESGEGDQQQPPEDKSGSSDKEHDKSQDQPTATSNESQDKDKEQKAQDKSAEEKDNSPEASSATQPSAAETAEEQPEEKDSVASEPADEIPESAEQRESRLLLQQIPDDPGGLLRRKFLYQYRQRGRQTQMDKSW